MAKLNEITDAEERKAKLSFVNEVWENWQDSRQSTLSRISNYIFTLNTGALLVALTYVATKGNSAPIQRSILVFSIGVFCSLIHAAIDYYSIEKNFKEYRSDVNELYDNKIEWEEFVSRNEARNNYDVLLHCIGWAGGLSFIFALINGIINIG